MRHTKMLEDLQDYCLKKIAMNDRIFSEVQGYGAESREKRSIHDAKCVAYEDVLELIEICLNNLKEV